MDAVTPLAQRLRQPFTAFVANKSSEAGGWSEACLNCASPLSGPFCAQCGQRAIPPYPSVRELVTDAFWELSGWDGRFAGSLRALLRAPGHLTTAFLEGRRVRYISPLRLYLMASLVYFVLAAAAPAVGRSSVVDAPGIKIGVGAPTAAGRVQSAALEARAGELTSAERDAALKDIEHAPAVLRPVLRRSLVDPKGFRRSMLETLPRVLFALVPVFAAIVGLFYRRRKYPEHLYFGLHLHAFIFAALSVSVLARFTRITPVASAVGLIVALWIVVYAVRAFRAVYRETLGKTIAKAAGISMLYSLTGGLALIGLVFWTALFS